MAYHRPIVLIVEDEPFITMLYEEIVTDAGLSVGGSFASCKSAEEWLSIHSPDVAIIDIKLEDGNQNRTLPPFEIPIAHRSEWLVRYCSIP